MTASQLTECSHLEWRITFGRWVRLDHVDHALKFILIALVDVMLPILLTWMTQLFLKCGISCSFSLTGWSHEERCIFFALLLRRDTEKLQVPKRIQTSDLQILHCDRFYHWLCLSQAIPWFIYFKMLEITNAKL